MEVDFTKLKKHIETQEGLDRYYVLNMTGVTYKEISLYGACIDVYESDNRYLIKIHNMSNRLLNYRGNTNERYNFCVAECDKYISNHEELVIKQDNRIIVINNKAKILLDKIIEDDIIGVSVIFNTLLIINSVSETLICNIHTGDILTTIEPKLGYIASQSKNWIINKSHKLKLFKCKELLLTASIDTRYISEDIKNFKGEESELSSVELINNTLIYNYLYYEYRERTIEMFQDNKELIKGNIKNSLMGDKEMIEQIKNNNIKVRIIYKGNRSNKIVDFIFLSEDFE